MLIHDTEQKLFIHRTRFFCVFHLCNSFPDNVGEVKPELRLKGHTKEGLG